MTVILQVVILIYRRGLARHRQENHMTAWMIPRLDLKTWNRVQTGGSSLVGTTALSVPDFGLENGQVIETGRFFITIIFQRTCFEWMTVQHGFTRLCHDTTYRN